MYAVVEQQLASVEWLLEHGAAPDTRGALGLTALMTAVTKGNVQITRALLRAGADCRVTEDVYGSTPLHYAAIVGHTYLAELLLKHAATAAGAGAPLVELRDFAGCTALHQAASNGFAELVALLLRSGAAVDARDVRGRTSLSFASAAGSAQVVRILLHARADVDSADEDGNTPLSVAANAATRKLLAPHSKAPQKPAPVTPEKGTGGGDALLGGSADVAGGPETPPQDAMMAGGGAAGDSGGKKKRKPKRKGASSTADDDGAPAAPSKPSSADAEIAQTAAAIAAAAAAATAAMMRDGDAAAVLAAERAAALSATVSGILAKVNKASEAASAMEAAEAAQAARVAKARNREARAAARRAAEEAARAAEAAEAAEAAAAVDSVLEAVVSDILEERYELRAAFQHWRSMALYAAALRAANTERQTALAVLESAYGGRLDALVSAAEAPATGCSAAHCPLCPRESTLTTSGGFSWMAEAVVPPMLPAAPAERHSVALSYGRVRIAARICGEMLRLPRLSPVQGAIRRQLLYYFSAANLARDAHLRSRMDLASGFVPIATVAGFNRVRYLTAERPSPELVASALLGCRLLEVSADGAGVRCHDWRRWLLHDPAARAAAGRTLRGDAPAFVPHVETEGHAAAVAAFAEYASAYRDAACAALAAGDMALRAWRDAASGATRRGHAAAAVVEHAKAALLAACNDAEAERRWGDAAACAVRDAAAALHAAARALRPAAAAEDWVPAAAERAPRTKRYAGGGAWAASGDAYSRQTGVKVGARDARLAVTLEGKVVAAAGGAGAEQWTVARLHDARR